MERLAVEDLQGREGAGGAVDLDGEEYVLVVRVGRAGGLDLLQVGELGLQRLMRVLVLLPRPSPALKDLHLGLTLTLGLLAVRGFAATRVFAVIDIVCVKGRVHILAGADRLRSRGSWLTQVRRTRRRSHGDPVGAR